MTKSISGRAAPLARAAGSTCKYVVKTHGGAFKNNFVLVAHEVGLTFTGARQAVETFLHCQLFFSPMLSFFLSAPFSWVNRVSSSW
jgi:hypothetical protein